MQNKERIICVVFFSFIDCILSVSSFVSAEGLIPSNGTSISLNPNNDILRVNHTDAVDGINQYHFDRFDLTSDQIVQFTLRGNDDVQVIVQEEAGVTSIDGLIYIYGEPDIRPQPVFHIHSTNDITFRGPHPNFTTNISGLVLHLSTNDNHNILLDNAVLDQGRRIFIDTGMLSLINDSRISPPPSPFTSLEIHAREGVTLTGSQITNSTTTPNQSGRIVIQTPEMTLNESRIHARSGNGIAGDILISTNDLELFKSSYISVSSLSSQNSADNEFSPAGGNITINGYNEQNANLLLIDNFSRIYAHALEGNGGVININTNYFIGLPSYIDATSTYGEDGIVNLSVFNDTEREVSNIILPVLENDQKLIDKPCQKYAHRKMSQFLIGGKQGLPVTPEQMLPASVSTLRIRNGRFEKVVAQQEKQSNYISPSTFMDFECHGG